MYEAAYVMTQGFVTMGVVSDVFKTFRFASVVLDVNVSYSEEVVECCAVVVEVLLSMLSVYEHVHFWGDL